MFVELKGIILGRWIAGAVGVELGIKNRNESVRLNVNVAENLDEQDTNAACEAGERGMGFAKCGSTAHQVHPLSPGQSLAPEHPLLRIPTARVGVHETPRPPAPVVPVVARGVRRVVRRAGRAVREGDARAPRRQPHPRGPGPRTRRRPSDVVVGIGRDEGAPTPVERSEDGAPVHAGAPLASAGLRRGDVDLLVRQQLLQHADANARRRLMLYL